MVGNDIIDLNEARCSSNWERPGFLHKIFTPKEQLIIAESADSFTTVWHLWSMKESAYKVFIQAGGKPFFNPTRIECSIDAEQNGEVLIDGISLKTCTSIHSDYIFSTATLNNTDLDTAIFQLTETNSKHQSAFMQQQLLNDFSEKNTLDCAKLHLKKTEAGVPILHYKNVLLNASISITHHGNYGAYSILKN